jgi:hypothetical protein
MIDNTMHLQGWYKLMTPTEPRKPTKAQLAAKAARLAEYERTVDEVIERYKKFT